MGTTERDIQHINLTNYLQFVGLELNWVTHQAMGFFPDKRNCYSKTSTQLKSSHGECDKTCSAASQFECH